MESNLMQDDKNIIVMKLLHYFITEKNYNPIILQGVEDEIWLENLEEDYKVIRIVSGSIYNDEQFDFDVFKTKRIAKKIQKKTLSLSINVLSIFLNLGENVKENLNGNKHLLCVKVTEEKDIKANKIMKEAFPDIDKKLTFSEKGMELFMKITNDINKHNQTDAKKIENVFKSKTPIITYALIIINVLLYLMPFLFNNYEEIISRYCIYGYAIRAGEYYRLITGIFLHGSVLHLVLNCYSLYIIGGQIENFFGKVKYLIIYLASGLMGSLFSMIFGGNTASIGASGAIFGLTGALLCFGYYYRVYLGNVMRSQIIPLVVANIVFGLVISGIDGFGHIGGLIGGVFTTMALGVQNKSTKTEKTNGLIITLILFAFALYMAFVYTA